MSNNMLEKIGKLLKQAEKAGTEEEAATFTAKAQSLASNYQVDLAAARQAAAKGEKREVPIQKGIRWGAMGTKTTKKHLVNLFSNVASNNGVRLNIYHDSSGVIAFGYPSDIEMAEVLFGSLAVQMVEAADIYVHSGSHKEETVWRSKRVPNPDYDRSDYGYWREPKTIEKWDYYPVDGRTARANFYQGFANKIGDRLREARQEAEAREVTVAEHFDDETGEQVEAEVTTGALVLVRKAEEVGDFYKSTSTARGSWSGPSSSNSISSARSAGSAAGASARISANRSLPGSRREIA